MAGPKRIKWSLLDESLKQIINDKAKTDDVYTKRETVEKIIETTYTKEEQDLRQQEIMNHIDSVMVDEDRRESNEVTRIENEDIRISQEVTRNENEDIRISQEKSRVLAEESRQSNETIRQQNEDERESNEVIRVSNEDERELNESNRVSAETDRVQAEITRQEGYNQAIDNFSTDSTQAINDFNTQGQQAIDDFDTQGQQAIDDFVTETERVEAIYSTRLTNVENDLAQHKLDYMPHQIKDLDNNKTYRYGLQIKDGVTQFIYEEVIE